MRDHREEQKRITKVAIEKIDFLNSKFKGILEDERNIDNLDDKIKYESSKYILLNESKDEEYFSRNYRKQLRDRYSFYDLINANIKDMYRNYNPLILIDVCCLNIMDTNKKF